jgi:uncharacterized protein (TIGR03437 family)
MLACVSCTAGEDIPAPAVSSLSPTHASAGSVVTINGSFFCQQTETEDPLACTNVGSVDFGSVPATVGMYSDQAITVEVPALQPGNVAVSVVSAGRRSNHVDFGVDP